MKGRVGGRRWVWKCVCVGDAVQTMCMIVLEQKEKREQARKQYFSFHCGACALFRKGWDDHKRVSV